MKQNDIIKDEQGELWLVFAVNEGSNKIYLRHIVDGEPKTPSVCVPLSVVRKTCTVVDIEFTGDDPEDELVRMLDEEAAE
jgi:hypothetical protein